MIHDVIYSLLAFIIKLAFFNKLFQGFIIFLINQTNMSIFTSTSNKTKNY